ncbi:unnamed protein product [Phytophthora lilii]|uniref:Unnamed protein product n=1 Tax=Phytophthora lilii TaxID=2077276 RepID=A0A9W6TZT3_9STRA|nr:unnamed protein product [Phytophthora lilii]
MVGDISPLRAVHARLRATLFGDIWLCHDTRDHNRAVAVKEVRLDLARQALARNLQLDDPFTESHTLNMLQMLGPHDNLMQVYQHFEQDDSWFVVMEYCEGGDLWQALQSEPHNRLPEFQALPLFAQIVRGVRLLHANGIAQRDLSLENILIGHGDDGATNTPEICDFGLSTKADRVCHERVRKAYYMAPEVVSGMKYAV